jgi:hypothetical protein
VLVRRQFLQATYPVRPDRQQLQREKMFAMNVLGTILRCL